MVNCIIIVGPTACGKTAFSIQLAKAVSGEIINADSMQVYKNLNIGTAKVTPNEMENIPHYLFDFVDEMSEYSVSDYKRDALNIITQITSNNHMPIIVGGTGFYINSILYNYEYGNTQKDESIRHKYEKMAEEFGNETVYNILKNLDSDTAKKLHPNDLKRVIRAIEIVEVTGIKKSDIKNNKSTYANHLEPYIIGLTMDREKLYDRINQRVDIMIQNGLIKEVEDLVKSGLNITHQSMSGIGYKEVLKYLNHEFTLEECIELIKKNTRNYAKRQLTWFRGMENVHWFDLTNGIQPEMIESILKELK